MKRFFSFFISKIFFVQLVIAAGLLFVLITVTGWGLAFFTEHNTEVKVPDLTGKSVVEASDILNTLGLRVEIYDTIAYSDAFAPFAVREQNPAVGKAVKPNRKVYIVLNRGEYDKIALPEVIQFTERNARIKLTSAGLKVRDSSIYIDAIGKNMVYGVQLGDSLVLAGTLIDQKELLVLVLGNGKDSIQ